MKKDPVYISFPPKYLHNCDNILIHVLVLSINLGRRTKELGNWTVEHA